MGFDYSPEDLSRDVQTSDATSERLEDWWERAHKRDHTFWLSGTVGQEVWERLSVRDRLKPGVKVLNIGVGLGQCTRQLHAEGVDVEVLDISQAALDRVADIARGWSAERLHELPKGEFDLALSHLVAQHMMDADLEAQFEAVIAALKPDGVFAVQFAVTDDPDMLEQLPIKAKGGSIQRRPEAVEALAVKAGGRVVYSQENEQFPQYRASWHVIHISPAA
jgi:SAM-dependent methyltransferase